MSLLEGSIFADYCSAEGATFRFQITDKSKKRCPRKAKKPARRHLLSGSKGQVKYVHFCMTHRTKLLSCKIESQSGQLFSSYKQFSYSKSTKIPLEVRDQSQMSPKKIKSLGAHRKTYFYQAVSLSEQFSFCSDNTATQTH